GGPAIGPQSGAIVPLVGAPAGPAIGPALGGLGGGIAGPGRVGPPAPLGPVGPVGGLWGGWVTGYYVNGDIHGTADRAGLDYDIGGVNFGLTRQIDPTLLVGGFLGFARNSVDVNDFDLGNYDVDTFQFGVYTRKIIGKAYFIGAATAGFDEYDVHRNVDYSFIQRPARANFHGNTASVFGEFGFTHCIGCSHFFQPFVSLQYSRIVRGGFEESGTFEKDRYNDYYDEATGYNVPLKFANDGDEFGSNLSVTETKDDFLRTRVGARYFRRFRNCAGTFRVIPEVRAFWAHEEYDPSSFTARMFDMHDCPFTVVGLDNVSDAAVVGGGLTFAHCAGCSLYTDVDVFLADRQTATAIALGTQICW
ncbi:MAG: autotransporter outer membrane beta-barrel domain-containing protein, partial [Planctomycetota bacterium]